MLTRQVVIKSNGRVLFRWEEVEGDTKTVYYYPQPGDDLVDVVRWLTVVPFEHPSKLVKVPVWFPEFNRTDEATPYRLVASKREGGFFRLSYYERNGNGEKVDVVKADELRGRLNVRLRQIENERAELPTLIGSV